MSKAIESIRAMARGYHERGMALPSLLRDLIAAADEIEQDRKQMAALHAACEAALAFHDRYCDRVGAADGWARAVHKKLQDALAQAGEQ